MRSSFLDNRVPPPLVGALLAAGMWFTAHLGPEYTLPLIARYTLAAVFALSGLAFDVLGLLAFRASKTTVNPLKPERASKLVIRGVYHVTRNPMYVGMACLLLAWAIYLSAWLPLAGPALFVLYITKFQILPEERVLRQLFGEEFEQYCARVRRWL